MPLQGSEGADADMLPLRTNPALSGVVRLQLDTDCDVETPQPPPPSIFPWFFGLSFSKLYPPQIRWLVLSSFIVVLRQFPLLLVEGF